MQKNINEVIKLLEKNNLESKAIDFINSLFGKKIIKNPKYKTFVVWAKENELEHIWENESEYAWYRDEWETLFATPDEFPENLPWICEDKFFSWPEDAIKYFFRKNPNLINEFLEKQTLV